MQSFPGKNFPVRLKLRTRLMIYAILIPAILILLGYLFMDRLLFFAVRTGPRAGNLVLRSGEYRLDAFYHPAPPGRPVILFSHGNGEILFDIMPFLNEMIRRNYGVMAYDYAGYGASEGKPGELQSCHDIESAFRFLTETEKIDPRRIVFCGFSVGGGPSCHMASKHPENPLVLAATFASAIQVVLPFSLPGDRFPNAKILSRQPIPVLIFHGTADSIVPYRNGKKLFASASGRKKFIPVPDADHNDLFAHLQETFWTELERFISENAPAAKSVPQQ